MSHWAKPADGRDYNRRMRNERSCIPSLFKGGFGGGITLIVIKRGMEKGARRMISSLLQPIGGESTSETGQEESQGEK